MVRSTLGPVKGTVCASSHHTWKKPQLHHQLPTPTTNTVCQCATFPNLCRDIAGLRNACVRLCVCKRLVRNCNGWGNLSAVCRKAHMSKILKALEREDIKYCMGWVGTSTLDRKDTQRLRRNSGNSRLCLGCPPCPGVLKHSFLSHPINLAVFPPAPLA